MPTAKKTLPDTRLGTLDLSVPQVRRSDQPFYPCALLRGPRSERALVVAIAEMYLQRLSTRRVPPDPSESLRAGNLLQSSQPRRRGTRFHARSLAQPPQPSHQPPPPRRPHEKVRVGGILRSCAVLTAILIAMDIRQHDGKRSILSVSVSLSEAEVHWRDFLRSLQARALIVCASIASDAHEGLKAALASVYPGLPWNRCQFHLQQNAQAYVPRQNLKEQIAAHIRATFHAEDLPHAQARLAATVEKHTATAPALARWMKANLPEAFTIFAFPEPVHQRLRTSNLCEALNKQIRRRTRQASIFPNPQSCMRLVSAILMEISEHWENSKAYLNP